MRRLALIAPLIAAPFFVASLSSMQIIAPAPVGCVNSLVHEPVVVYDIAGSTLLGPFFEHLTVYNDGHAIISATTYDPDPGQCQTAVLTPAEVVQLRQDLNAAGALTLCDDSGLIPSDLPLTTITMFRGTTNAAAHTFSYWGGFDPTYGPVDQVIRDLIAAKFPGF